MLWYVKSRLQLYVVSITMVKPVLGPLIDDPNIPPGRVRVRTLGGARLKYQFRQVFVDHFLQIIDQSSIGCKIRVRIGLFSW